VAAICWLVGGCSQGDASVSPVTTELRNILNADQSEPYPTGEPTDSAARVAFFRELWTERFKPRHDRVAELIRLDSLRSAEDYFVAGMIMNHGMEPEDNLLAHALLTVAAFKGHPDARWASAAAMDNYLTSIGKPQLYGTVYGDPRALLPTMTDALRRQFCVPGVTEQGELALLRRNGNDAEFERRKIRCDASR
jgi:hypothetical protein